jgi:hypothetical protein
MTRRSESLQRNLFEEDEPRVELAAAQKIDLAALMEVLLREIATALANGGKRPWPKSRLSIFHEVRASTSASQPPIS